MSFIGIYGVYIGIYKGLGFRVQGLRHHRTPEIKETFRAWGLGFRVQGFGFRGLGHQGPPELEETFIA